MNKQTWHRQIWADLVVAGLAPCMRVAWMRAVRQLSRYDGGTPPQTLSEEQVNDHLLWLRPNNRRLPVSSESRSADFDSYSERPADA